MEKITRFGVVILVVGISLLLVTIVRGATSTDVGTMSEDISSDKWTLYPTFLLAPRELRVGMQSNQTVDVYVLAVMARYNPFFEEAGMLRVAEYVPQLYVVKTMAALKAFGLDERFMTSRSYVLDKLTQLDEGTVRAIKQIFIAFEPSEVPPP